MEYLFDFGDCWRFKVQLEAVESEVSRLDGSQKSKQSKRRKSRKAIGEILEVQGKSPAQYPDYDDDW